MVNLTLNGCGVLIARVAQSVERSAVNRKVGGSNPPVSDIFMIIITQSSQHRGELHLLVSLDLAQILQADLVD